MAMTKVGLTSIISDNPVDRTKVNVYVSNFLQRAQKQELTFGEVYGIMYGMGVPEDQRLDLIRVLKEREELEEVGSNVTGGRYFILTEKQTKS